MTVLDGAAFTSVSRNSVAVDMQGRPFLVARLEGVAADGRAFTCWLDEAILKVKTDHIHPALLKALEDHA